MKEEELTKINQGKTATIILDMLSPTLRRMERAVIGRLKNMYLQGNASEQMLLACAAELCCLDALKNSLEADINQAQTISRNTGVMDGNEQNH